MKILEIAPYVTIDSKATLTRNKTGFGYMVYDIAAGLARENEVDMLLLNCQYNEFVNDGIRFLPNGKKKALRGMLRILSMPKFIAFILKYRMPAGSMLRFAYQWLLMSNLEKIIKTGNYDVAHIHGCTYINTFIIDICKKLNVKFVVTLHGLNSFDESISLEPAGKRFEKDFLKLAHRNNWPLTFISSGMKKRVMDYLKTDSADNIHVVCNSFKFRNAESAVVDVRTKYNIPADAKIILYVGNEGERKNQKQMVRAFARLHKRLQEKTYVLFLGRINEEYGLKDEISKLSRASHLIECGLVPKEEVSCYYRQADATALFSISEGFGLSLIEGMCFGLPCIAIRTMDAFDDIYSPDCMIGVEKHDDQLIADGLEKLITSAWDKDKIKEHAKMFTNEHMTRKYIDALT